MTKTVAGPAARKPPTAPGEIWKEIEGYEGRYLVSSHGRVWSVRRQCVAGCHGRSVRWTGGHLFRPGRTTCGYKQVVLCLGGGRATRLVHRLVLETFIGLPPDSMVDVHAHHVDGNHLNNRLDNLTWIDAQEHREGHHGVHKVDGKAAMIPTHARDHGLSPATVHWRLAQGMDLGAALKTPLRKEPNKLYTYRGKEFTRRQLAELAGIPYRTLCRRLLAGHTIEDAVERPPRGR